MIGGLLLLLGAVACGDKSTTPSPASPSSPSTFSLTGQVTDTLTGAPVAGATVSIGDSVNTGKSTSTDGSGTYSFVGLQQAGFTVSVSANGFVPSSKGVTLTSNQTLSFPLTRLTFSLNGIVTDAVSGAPLSDIVVTITDGANAGKSATTAGGGGYNIGSVLPGLFQMSAAAISYQTTTAAVTVSADTTVNFTLPRACTSAPGTPEFLGWTSAGLPAGSVQMNWAPKNEAIRSYIVEVGTTVGGTDVAVIDTRSTATSYTLSGLRTSVNMYHVRVRAKNACGVSPPSNEANPRIA
jgi:hypothetical protein